MTFGATNDEKWITAVGKFMLAFGSIEGSVNELIRQCTTEGLFKVMLPLLLAQRVKIAKELTVERKLSDINKSILLANLEEVVNLSPTRNPDCAQPAWAAVLQGRTASRARDRVGALAEANQLR